jgi:hypothetical protein
MLINAATLFISCQFLTFGAVRLLEALSAF